MMLNDVAAMSSVADTQLATRSDLEFRQARTPRCTQPGERNVAKGKAISLEPHFR